MLIFKIHNFSENKFSLPRYKQTEPKRFSAGQSKKLFVQKIVFRIVLLWMSQYTHVIFTFSGSLLDLFDVAKEGSCGPALHLKFD
jgi:hypothetical protein